MATIASIVKQGTGSAGSGGAWRCHTFDDPHGLYPGKRVSVLYHYSTLMLQWNEDDPSDPDVLDYSTGWGSVSDQGGMNTAFRVLGLPYRFDRSGGASITDLRIERAEREGKQHGQAAGSWVIDGNTSEQTARAILAGIRDGDPEVLDSLPSAPLSGEWADGLLPRDVLGWYGMDEDDPAADDVLTTFETAYADGMIEEVTRAARAIVCTRVGR